MDSIQEVMKANKRNGGHWFDDDTTRFFRSKVERTYRRTTGLVFITSEQFDDDSPRLFTVRDADDNGKVSTVGNFQRFATLDEAIAVAQTIRSAPWVCCFKCGKSQCACAV
jgi:hypothetical protein